ncbi:Uncharacterised protein [uncultured archaeon]|nr:Uncharacterised protein [uncultured archaeon]
MMKYALALLLISALACADVGPAPPKPEITMVLIKDGVQYTGPVWASYNCTEAGESNSIVGERTAQFTCTNGTCTNDAWFYKFNPCYYPKSGHMEYTFDGKLGYWSTANMAFDQGIAYRVEIDVDKQSVKKINLTPGLCPLALAPSALVLLLYAGRKAWN